MAKQTALEETIHFRNAEDADFDWHEHGRCRGRTGIVQQAWTVAHGGASRIGSITITNDRLIEFALSVCATCPVQWECAEFGLATNADDCTYAVDISHLRWLRKRGSYGRSLIAAARDLGVPVQVMVDNRERRSRRRRSYKKAAA